MVILKIGQEYRRFVLFIFLISIAGVLALNQSKVESIPTSGNNYAGGVGNNSWTSPYNAVGSGLSNCAQNQGTNNGWWNTFGFSIPSSATINGILVTTKQSQGSASSATWAVTLRKSDGGSDSNQRTYSETNTESCGASQPTRTYGSLTDLWGLSWTPDEINNAGFTVVVSTAGNGVRRLNWVSVQVNYTLPTSTSTITVNSTITNTETSTSTVTSTQILTSTVTSTSNQTLTSTVTSTTTHTTTMNYTSTSTQILTSTVTITSTQTLTSTVTSASTQTSTQTLTSTVTSTTSLHSTSTVTKTETLHEKTTFTSSITQTVVTPLNEILTYAWGIVVTVMAAIIIVIYLRRVGIGKNPDWRPSWGLIPPGPSKSTWFWTHNFKPTSSNENALIPLISILVMNW